MNSVVTSLLVVILHIVLTDCLSQQGCGMGATTQRQRILKGKNSSPGMWPWQVGIHKQDIADDSRYDIICGGALIDPQWVVTAAHCFYAKRMSSSKIWFEADTTPLKKYKIVAGDINTQIIESFQQERYPVEMYIHPGYRHAPYYENDIALVKLNKPVNTSNLVGTVCLPDGNIDLAKPGTVGTVAGWGRTSKAWKSTLLLHTSLLIRTKTVCKQATNYYVNETVTFCAGDDHGGNDTCKGDSGGSLVRRVTVKGQRRWVTVGLVSWGEGCGLPGKYGYYTRMHPFVTWIKDTMFSCGHPGDIPFGKLISVHNMTRFPMNFRVKYKCNSGYILKGNSGRKCKSGGNWTSPPVCVKERHCPFVRHPRHGIRRPNKRRYSYKDKIRFYCVTNHVMIGRYYLTCQIDGRWDGYPPLCLVQKRCERTNPKPFRFCVDKQCKTDGDCGKKQKCLCDGDCGWSCVDNDLRCDPLSKPKNGEIKVSGSGFGQTVTYKCKNGYTMGGSKKRTCTGIGKWDGKRTTCPRLCKDPGDVAFGNNNGYRRYYKVGHKINYWCFAGFEREGASTIQCTKAGKWKPSPPKCQHYSPCGVSPTSFRARIVGGNKAGRGTWPWQVGLYNSGMDGNLDLICGGALINHQWVLTAARCFYHYNVFTRRREIQSIPASQYIVKAGDDHLRMKEPAQQDIEATGIYIHNNYRDSLKLENDIALLKLSKKVKLGPFVRTVCLPRKDEDLVVAGRHGYVAGWGVTQVLNLGQNPSRENKNSKTLQHSAFTIQHKATCAKTKFFFNPNVTFCAGSGLGGNDTCRGDSGGSFVRQSPRGKNEHRWVSVGIASWGEGCGLKGKYTYYTRVEPYVDWIKKTIQDNTN